VTAFYLFGTVDTLKHFTVQPSKWSSLSQLGVHFAVTWNFVFTFLCIGVLINGPLGFLLPQRAACPFRDRGLVPSAGGLNATCCGND
jgi:hypothetical protein